MSDGPDTGYSQSDNRNDGPEEEGLFLVELDTMIESTDEFIADDNVTVHDDPEGRLVDALCLQHVRKLYTDVFQPRED